MATVRVKGVKRYRVKGKWFAYHRKTGIRIKAEFGTGEFFAELAALERKLSVRNRPDPPGAVLSSRVDSAAIPIHPHDSPRISRIILPIVD